MRSRTAIGGAIIPVDGADIGVASCLENDHGRKLLLSTVEVPGQIQIFTLYTGVKQSCQVQAEHGGTSHHYYNC